MASAPSRPHRAPVMSILFSSRLSGREGVDHRESAYVIGRLPWAMPGRMSDTPVFHVVVGAPASVRVHASARFAGVRHRLYRLASDASREER